MRPNSYSSIRHCCATCHFQSFVLNDQAICMFGEEYTIDECFNVMEINSVPIMEILLESDSFVDRFRVDDAAVCDAWQPMESK